MPSPLVVDNPFTGEPACTVDLAGVNEVVRILDRARVAQRAYRSSTVAERAALCERAIAAMETHKDAICADISAMMGKPIVQARNEVAGMALRGRHMISMAEDCLREVIVPRKDGFDRRVAKEPLGTVLDLPAWNYPLLTCVNVVIPAVLAGNSVIIKHSPRSPLCGEHFARAFLAAHAPDGLVQALHCDHPTTEAAVADSRVDHVVFTGSVLGGHRIQQAAAGRFLHIGLELGGNDPAYVAPDCDLAATVENLVDGAIYNAGQSCCAVERVYVHRSQYEAFVAAAEPLVRAYVMGDPMDEKTTLGPIAQPNHVVELEGVVIEAKAKGAKIVVGGRPTSVDGRGRFFQATLIRDVTQAMRITQGESFGPVLPVSVVDSDEEALARMNQSALGLTASIWTKDRERARAMAKALEFGTVYMNRCDAVDPALPWGGVKDSGRGVSLGALGFDQLTRPKALHFKLRAGG
jgi:acyl-CoA reductase-like NAD-dependent aldehyde dehydrogenase